MVSLCELCLRPRRMQHLFELPLGFLFGTLGPSSGGRMRGAWLTCAAVPGGCGSPDQEAPVRPAKSTTSAPRPAEPRHSQVLGDRDYSSALPARQQLNPRVVQIFIDFE
jgi:hypothetical protein